MALDFYINNHRATEYTFFYKLTTANNYSTSFRVYDTESATISSYVQLFVNKQSVYGPILINPELSFYSLDIIRTVPTLCSFYVDISSNDQQYITTLELSAKIVPYFLSADFVGFPGSYFSSGRTLSILDSNNFLEKSPGMFFYGEGHTDNIYLSAVNLDPAATTYTWKISGTTTLYPVSASNLAQPLLTSFITLTSDTDTDLNLPVSLHVTNSDFSINDPIFYRDDNTGLPVFYPYYATTTDIYGNELVSNTYIKESIRVKPYDPIEYIFEPGIDTIISLPINGSQKAYEATFRTALSGRNTLSRCYGKYGFAWNWSTFANCTAEPRSFTNKPSSWETVSCLSGGKFPKNWVDSTAEIGASAAIFNTNPVFCTSTATVWTLSTLKWSDIQINTSTPYFNYLLSLKDNGNKKYTTSFLDNTLLTLNAQQTATCQISATTLPVGYTNDWKPKNTILSLFHSITSIAPPALKIYTPNRFVLTGTEVKFENLIERKNLITKLEIDYDDGKTQTILGPNLQTTVLSASYNILGFKTLKLRAYVNYDSIPIDVVFPNLIQVLKQYDEVSPTEYRSSFTPIQLPWPGPPLVGSNDWVIEDTINSSIKKINDNLSYLESRGSYYPGTFSDYFGYLGVPPTIINNVSACPVWTWEDLDCLNTTLLYNVTWRDVFLDSFSGDSGVYVDCGTWEQLECGTSSDPSCYGKFDKIWNWKQQKKGNSLDAVTWYDTRCVGVTGTKYPKLWRYEPGSSILNIICDEGTWNVNIPGIDTFYDPIANSRIQNRCIYTGIASRNNKIFTVQKTQVKLLDSDRTATYLSNLFTLDGVTTFSDLKNICLDSSGKIFILDKILSQIGVYTYEPDTPGSDWKQFITWGGFGTATSKTGFSNPNDIHIDQFDNVWVCDTGNSSIKHYSNTGTWLNTITDNELQIYPPLSLAVDSQGNIHVLTTNSVRVYTYTGEYIQEYFYNEFVTSTSPQKINTSYNREVIYIAFDTQVVKFFRTGRFFGYIIQQKQEVNNITGIYQDEFRNLLITTNDKILKYADIMSLKRTKGQLPSNYWQINDLLIHKEEYVQNWVYTKAFQRLWDNIEIFRNTLLYTGEECKTYKPPVHGKEKMIVGQNEIVTSVVVNRVLGYLWDNFYSLVDYFDPYCNSR